MKIEYIILLLVAIWIIYLYRERIMKTQKIIEKLANVSNGMITSLTDKRLDIEYDNDDLSDESKLSMIFKNADKHLLYYESYNKKTNKFLFLILFFNTENDNEINNYSSGMVFYTNRINYIFNILNKGKFKKDISSFGLSDQFRPLMKYETAETIDMSDIIKLRYNIELDLEKMGFEYNVDIKY